MNQLRTDALGAGGRRRLGSGDGEGGGDTWTAPQASANAERRAIFVDERTREHGDHDGILTYRSRGAENDVMRIGEVKKWDFREFLKCFLLIV